MAKTKSKPKPKQAPQQPGQWRTRIVGHDRVAPDQLVANPLNFRTHPQAQREALAAAIKEVGFIRSVTVNKRTGNLVDGHERVWQALQTEQEFIDVEDVDLSEEEERLALATMDPISELATVDAGKLDELLREVNTGDAALQQLLSDLAEDNGVLDGVNGEVIEDEVPEPPVDPITKPGDLWLLGEHRLLCGDSTKAEDVGRVMAGARAGMMVTDPPYGVDYNGGQANDKKREKLSGDNTTEVFNAGLSAALNAVLSGAWYIWHADRYAEPVYAAIRKCGFDVRALIVWNKLKAHYGAPSAHYCQKHEPCLYAVRDSAGFCGPSNEVTVCDIEQPHRNEHHPTQKPIICMARAIRNHEAESVYDPFLGSGTTLIAAEQLGRKCYGLEISPAYCDVIVKRWETLTGKKAKLGK